jgi:hypothetical protein
MQYGLQIARAPSGDVNHASLVLQNMERKLRAGGLLNKYI